MAEILAKLERMNRDLPLIQISHTLSQFLLAHSVMSNSLQPHGLQPARLFCPCGSPGKNIGVGCHFLLHISIHLYPDFVGVGCTFPM